MICNLTIDRRFLSLQCGRFGQANMPHPACVDPKHPKLLGMTQLCTSVPGRCKKLLCRSWIRALLGWTLLAFALVIMTDGLSDFDETVGHTREKDDKSGRRSSLFMWKRLTRSTPGRGSTQNGGRICEACRIVRYLRLLDLVKEP